MTVRRHPQAVVAVVFTCATLLSMGPHLLMLGYKMAGAAPPAALLLLCPLHQIEARETPRFTLHVRPLT